MDLDEAFKKAIQKYYAGHSYSKYEETVGKPLKYNKQALDDVEAEVRKKYESSKAKESQDGGI